MNREVKDILDQRRKLMVLEYAKAIDSNARCNFRFSADAPIFNNYQTPYSFEQKILHSIRRPDGILIMRIKKGQLICCSTINRHYV
jgi:hypothetical protein